MTLRLMRLVPMLAVAVPLDAGCDAHETTPAHRTGHAESSGATSGQGAMDGTLYGPGRQFAQTYCASCHWRDGQDPKQHVAYPAFHVDTYDDWASSRTILLAVLDKWNPDGDVMPPPDAIEPADEERRTILDWIRRNSPNTRDGE